MVLHFVEAAPACVFRRNGIALDPAAVGVLEKVLAGTAGGVEIGEIEAVAVRSAAATAFGTRPRLPGKAMSTAARIIMPENITSTLVFCMAAPDVRVESSRIFAPSSPSQTAAGGIVRFSSSSPQRMAARADIDGERGVTMLHISLHRVQASNVVRALLR